LCLAFSSPTHSDDYFLEHDLTRKREVQLVKRLLKVMDNGKLKA
jgi:hypothetical protein